MQPYLTHAKGKGRGKDGMGARRPYKLFAVVCVSFLGECSFSGVQSAFLSFSLLSFPFYDASSWCHNPFGLDLFPHTPPFLGEKEKKGVPHYNCARWFEVGKGYTCLKSAAAIALRAACSGL